MFELPTNNTRLPTTHFLLLLLVVSCWLLPTLASAHEVYVLDEHTIAEALATTSPNPVGAFAGNEQSFFLWGFIAIVVTLTVFFASTFRRAEGALAPLFMQLKRYAHPLVRIAAGVTLIVFGSTATLYGQELPFDAIFGALSSMMQAVMLLLGIAIVLGFQTRIMASLALLIYCFAATQIGIYALNYVQYVGAYLLLIILGGGPLTIDHHFHLGWHARKKLERYGAYAFPLLRISLGASIIFASFYAKFLHSNLALTVVETYNLQALFPFDPLFIVLGAFIIEFLAGLMLVIGVEIRWTALFLVFWLTLAHLYFPEAWYVHLSLYGFGIAILCHGYDRLTLEGRFFKKRLMEPVL